MSNVSTFEPQTHGLIILKTSFGDLEIELFTNQCPRITRNFVQLCLDGFYNGTIFDRVERDFIAIGGRLKKTEAEIGTLVSETCNDEFHSRLKFSRRGLLATANTEKNGNGHEFFFTLGAAPELQNKHSIFGRLRGKSVYCLVDLNECPVDDDLVPISEKQILATNVIENPFPDLHVRPAILEKLISLRSNSRIDDNRAELLLEPKKNVKSSSKKLSFYRESDEDDEDETGLDSFSILDTKDARSEQEPKRDMTLGNPSQAGDVEIRNREDESKDDFSEPISPMTKESARAKRLREIREQFQSIKNQIDHSASSCLPLDNEAEKTSSTIVHVKDPELEVELRLASKKDRHREQNTLDMLENFKKKLKETRGKCLSSNNDNASERTKPGSEKLPSDVSIADEETELAEALISVDGDAWLHHRFEADVDSDRMAKDANLKGDDWYSIDDPRNPLVNRVEADKARNYRAHRSKWSSHSSRHRHSSHDSKLSSRSGSSALYSSSKDSHHRPRDS